MLKSCSYCGKIHDTRKPCAEKKARQKECQRQRNNSRAKIFHHSSRWARKSKAIKERDHYMCLCCKAGMGHGKVYNTDTLEVHHIIPIEEDDNRKLDDDNLITVCRVHHEQCENGRISREKQKELVTESMHEENSEGGRGYICIIILRYLQKRRPWAGIPPPVILLFSGGSNDRRPTIIYKKFPK